jgi:hypothetical protein
VPRPEKNDARFSKNDARFFQKEPPFFQNEALFWSKGAASVRKVHGMVIKKDYFFCSTLVFSYLSSKNLKTNCPVKQISGHRSISKEHANITRQPIFFRV